MKDYTDPDVFLSGINQLRGDTSYLDEVVFAESLATIILDALPAEKYSAIKLEAIRYPSLSLEQIIRKGSSTKNSQEF